MEVFTLKQLIEYLKCSESTIRKLVRNKAIPFFRLGNKLYFSKTAIELWVKQQEAVNLQVVNY